MTQNTDEFGETLEEMQENLFQNIKDGGVPRDLWEHVILGSEGIVDAKEFAAYRDRMIFVHGYQL